MNSNEISDLQLVCDQFRAGNRAERWITDNGRVKIGVTSERVVIGMVGTTQAAADTWQEACKKIAKDGTYRYSQWSQTEHRISFEPK